MSDTKDMLLDAAETGIRHKGYNAVSFRDLAAELGIKSASVHYHFPKKEDLGRATVARYVDRFFTALNARASSATTPRAKLEALCATYRDALAGADAICLCGMLGAEAYSLPEALAADVARFFDANIAWCMDALPDTLSEADRRARAAHVISALQGAMMMATNLKDTGHFDRTAALLCDDAVAG